MTRREFVFDLDDDNEESQHGNDQPSTSTQRSYSNVGVQDQDYKPSSSQKQPKEKEAATDDGNSKRETRRCASVKSASKFVNKKPQSSSTLKRGRPSNKELNLGTENDGNKLLKFDRFDIKDNAFIDKQPRLQFNPESSIGQAVRNCSASLTAGEIRLSLRKMNEDQLLASLVQNIDDILEENEQLLQIVDKMNNDYSDLEQRYAQLQQKLKALQNGTNQVEEETPNISKPRGCSPIRKKTGTIFEKRKATLTGKRLIGRPRTKQNLSGASVTQSQEVVLDSEIDEDVPVKSSFDGDESVESNFDRESSINPTFDEETSQREGNIDVLGENEEVPAQNTVTYPESYYEDEF